MTAEARSRIRLEQRHNLPDGLSSFVGRAREVGEIADLLEDSRLLTLVGAGGVGKTRLAVAAANQVVSRYAGGAWLVELAPIASGALLYQAIASALNLREQPGRSLLETLVDGVRLERTLLVLDNCEHLLVACAEVAAVLLPRCPRLAIMATSREPMGITGEVTWRVPSLRVPPPAPPPVELLGEYEAVRLFIDRAMAVQPGFRVTNQNAPAVAELCLRVDGIPLAIELAAAWVRVLSPEQILPRLNDALHLLVGGSRTAPARQQTLRAAIEWSYRLLDEREQLMFQRLGVFAGGWTLEAAEGICADDEIPVEDILGLLARLVDKSLVIAELQDESGVVRYRLLELLRAYSRERAAQAGQLWPVERRHRDWFVALAKRLPAELLDASHIAGLERERDNVRAALDWTIDVGDTDEGLGFAAAMWPVWYVHGYYAEGRAWLREVLDLPLRAGPTHGRARALAVAGHLAYCQGDYATAESLLQQAAATASDADDEQTTAIVLQFRGNLARGAGDLGSARELYRQAHELNHRLESPIWEAMSLVGEGQAAADQHSDAEAEYFAAQSLALCEREGHRWGAARALWILGRVASSRGDVTAANRLLQECMTYQREFGDRQGLVWASLDLARNAARAGDTSMAAASLVAGLELAEQLGDRLSMVRAVEGIATLVSATDAVLAIRIACAAGVLRQTIGAAQPDAPVEAALATARCALGAGAYNAACADGRALHFERAVEEAVNAMRRLRQPAERGQRTHSPDKPVADPLTRREREVATLLAQGLTDRQIAERLVITEGTVGVHVTHILSKLEVHSRAQIAVWLVGHPAN